MTEDSTTTIESAAFTLGCFWGAEQLFASLQGVIASEVGYCDGREVVWLQFQPDIISYNQLLTYFWQHHTPTLGAPHAYQSTIWPTTPNQNNLAQASRVACQHVLDTSGETDPIMTEITPFIGFISAEEKHQRYWQKHPSRVCPLRANGLPLVCI